MGTITDVHEAKAKQALNIAQHVTALNDLAYKQMELEKLTIGSLVVDDLAAIENLMRPISSVMPKP